MRILFTTVGLSGHFFPLVPLAWAARSLGHEVLVATPADFLATVLRSGLPAASCAPTGDLLTLVGVTSGSVEDCRHANGRAFGRSAARTLPDVMSLVEGWAPDLVVSERAEFAGPIAAYVNGVPQVELQWGVAALPEYRAAGDAELAEELAALGLPGLPRPVRVLNPWPPSLRLAHAADHRSLRHVSYNGDAHVPEWLWEPRRKPRICLTLGTVLPHVGPDKVSETVVAQLEALASLDAELVVAVDDRVAATWPRLPESVRHVGRLPLAQALRSCDVAIHHGGQGTSLTALDAGVPQLVLPVFDDQLDNADAVVRSGAGLQIPAEEATPVAVVEYCVELLERPRFARRAARVAAEIARQPLPIDLVGGLQELAVRRLAA